MVCPQRLVQVSVPSALPPVTVTSLAVLRGWWRSHNWAQFLAEDGPSG
jgi:hypothetical protein